MSVWAKRVRATKDTDMAEIWGEFIGRRDWCCEVQRWKVEISLVRQGRDSDAEIWQGQR